MKMKVYFWISILNGLMGQTVSVDSKIIRETLPGCELSRMKLRMNMIHLLESERKVFINAIDSLNGKSSPNKWSNLMTETWKRYNTTKNLQDDLEWNRLLLYYAEQELQTVNSSITIPYWDWSKFSHSIKEDPMLNDGLFGGRTNKDGCLYLTQFKLSQKNLNKEKRETFENTMNQPASDIIYNNKNKGESCLIRHISPTELKLPSVNEINHILNENSFTTVYNFLKKLIPRVNQHENSFAVPSFYPIQPEDPLFLPYIAFIDKLWLDWQRRHLKNYRLTLTKHGATLAPWGIPINHIQDPLTRLCYQYPEEHFAWDSINQLPTTGPRIYCSQ